MPLKYKKFSILMYETTRPLQPKATHVESHFLNAIKRNKFFFGVDQATLLLTCKFSRQTISIFPAAGRVHKEE